jgi:hypothetical protein
MFGLYSLTKCDVPLRRTREGRNDDDEEKNTEMSVRIDCRYGMLLRIEKEKKRDDDEEKNAKVSMHQMSAYIIFLCVLTIDVSGKQRRINFFILMLSH